MKCVPLEHLPDLTKYMIGVLWENMTNKTVVVNNPTPTVVKN